LTPKKGKNSGFLRRLFSFKIINANSGVKGLDFLEYVYQIFQFKKINKYNKFLTKFKICHIIIIESTDSGPERGFFTVQNSGYAKALFVPKIDFFPPKTMHNPWVLVLSVRKSSNSAVTPIMENYNIICGLSLGKIFKKYKRKYLDFK
jgi:hypothetical protein